MRTSTIMWTGVAGALAALLFDLPSLLPPAIAHEQPARTLLSTGNQLFGPAVDPDKLLKWDFTVDPGVSTEPLKEHTIRKIGYGRTSFVQVVETATGTYSSDGLDSSHIQYPGITKERRHDVAALAYWNGKGWSLAAPFTAGSFVIVTALAGGEPVDPNGGTCVVDGNSLRC